MSNLSTPSQARIPLGTVMVNGQRVEVMINPEWARFFEALTDQTSGNAAIAANGRNAADAAAVAFLASEGVEDSAPVPGPPGAHGRQGDPGLALFMLQDDSGGDSGIPYAPGDGLYAKVTARDASGGYAGLTLFALNLKNVAGTVTSWLTNAATAARTWTMPDKDGTVAMLSDFASPPVIGATEPAAGKFTTVKATSAYANTSDLQMVASGNIPGVNLRSSGGGRLSLVTGYIAANTSSVLLATGVENPALEAMRFDHASGAVRVHTGSLTVATGFGCNGKAAQGPAVSGGTTAGVIAALVANGILSS